MTDLDDLVPARVRFPSRCVECGGVPDASFTLAAFRGWDMIYFRWGRSCELVVPACRACAWRKRRGYAIWMVGLFCALLASIIAPSLVLRAVLDATSVKEPVALPAFILLGMPAWLAMIWWCRNRAGETFHRRKSAVAIVDYDRRLDRVTLWFRAPALRHEVAVLMGRADPAHAPEAASAGYRDAAGRIPEAWTPPTPRTLPWWAVSVAGLFVLAVGVVECSRFAFTERHRGTMSTQAMVLGIYNLGGKFAVLGVFGLGGLVLIGMGFFLRFPRRAFDREVRNGRGSGTTESLATGEDEPLP